MIIDLQGATAAAAVGTLPQSRPAADRNQWNTSMQNQSSALGTQTRRHLKPARQEEPTPKEITLKTLAQVKARLYENAARSIKLNPDKADIIQKAVDRDAARFAFVINTINVKF